MYASSDPWFAITGLMIMLLIAAVIVLADYEWHAHREHPGTARRRGHHHRLWDHIRRGH